MRHALAVLSALTLAVPSAAGQPPQPASTEAINLGLRGVYFVENQGQWSDASVHYGFKTRGLDIAFRESSFTMHLARESGSTSRAREEAGLDERRAATLLSPEIAPDARSCDDLNPAYEHLTLTVTFPGSNDVIPEAARPQSAKFNYYIGDDESKWASNVPSFGEVIYPNLYDGVDLHITGAPDASGVLKYEFHVASGADWSQIQIAYDGIDSLCIDDTGDLRINTTFGTLTDAAPLVWQEGSTSRDCKGAVLDDGDPTPLPDGSTRSRSADGRGSSDHRDPVPAHFELVDGAKYRIALDVPVDPTRELIIDPDVEWMVYLGGSGYEHGSVLAVNSTGKTLVSGTTSSQDYVGRTNSYFGGSCDVFVVSVAQSGSVEWMTYLGGTVWDTCEAIAIDSDDTIVVAGTTASTDFSGRINSYLGAWDSYLARLSSEGALLWMRYLGGTEDDEATGLAIGSAGEIMVIGGTSSTRVLGRLNSFHGGYRDACLYRLDADGATDWMVYLGGSDSDGAKQVVLDGAGNALIAGYTRSSNFEGQVNAFHGGTWWGDAFCTLVDAQGSIQWVRYIGGSGEDAAFAMAIGASGDLAIVGRTDSPDFEQARNSYLGGEADGFLVKASSIGEPVWMRYVGGTGTEFAEDVVISPSNSYLVAGTTDSADFSARQNEARGGRDVFLMGVTQTSVVQGMIYIGGAANEGDGSEHPSTSIVLGNSAELVLSSTTTSSDFDGRLNEFLGGDEDAVLLVVSDADAWGPTLSVTSTCPSGGPIHIEWSGATPDAPAALIYARNTGSFVIPNSQPCRGTTLGLGTNQIQLVTVLNSDPNGSRTLNSNAGPGACGGYLQLLDLTTCATSNVERIE